MDVLLNVLNRSHVSQHQSNFGSSTSPRTTHCEAHPKVTKTRRLEQEILARPQDSLRFRSLTVSLRLAIRRWFDISCRSRSVCTRLCGRSGLSQQSPREYYQKRSDASYRACSGRANKSRLGSTAAQEPTTTRTKSPF